MEKNLSYEDLLKKIEQLEKENERLKNNTFINQYEALVKSCIDFLPFTAWIKDIQGRFLHVNYNYSRKVYKPISEIVGKTDYDLYPEEEAKQFELDDKKVIETKEKQIFQGKVNGHHLQTVKYPLLSDGGEIYGTIGYQRDVTLEKEALASLTQERDLMQALINNISYTVYFKDKEGKFIRINNAQAKMIGVDKASEAIGKTDFDFFPKYHAQGAWKDEQAIMKTGKPVVEKVEKLTNAKNEIRWVSATKYPLYDKSGEVIGIVGLSRDITVDRQAKQNLKRAKEKAEESDRLKTAFLANMSHEIRTPMNGIIGFANLLKSPELTAQERVEFLEHIDACGESLLTLIDDIIDISKIEAGQIKIKKILCDINHILDELFESFKNIKSREGKEEIDLILHKDINNELSLITDPNRVKQIITNLIGNALKFTPSGSIEFGYKKKTNEELEFYVKDTGVGIPKDKQQLIFERFGQVVDTSQVNPRGTGLGLAISINLVRLLGGNMWVESEPGKGSTFYFTIPHVIEEETENKETLAGWANKTILVAEDEDEGWLLIKNILENTLARLIWAKNGKEALEICQKNPNINLILMDLKMPEMDGYQATKEIRKFRENIPIIAQTAYDWPNEEKESLKVGCDDYIHKPIKKEALLRSLKSFLGEY